jgi:hypothetical protein
VQDGILLSALSWNQGGRDVAKLAVLVLAFAATFARAQSVGEVPTEPLADLKAPIIGSALTCSEPFQEKISVPVVVIERARLKARLVNLLHLSLLDDAAGILNIKREKEIRKLANKLKHTP